MTNDPTVHPNYAVVVEKDVDVPMRDGVRLKADVFRPQDAGKFPAILNLGPYQKDKPWVVPDTLEEPPNEWMNWETINPKWWVPRGYAAIRVDSRGTGKSPGQYEPWSLAEAVDFYDAIEWAAAQPWCNGNVGLLGISYFAINQWFVANLRPPSLKALIPWEGFADLYRDALFHGGILSLFMTNWYTAHMLHHLLGRASREVADGWHINTLHFWLHNSLDSGAFRGSQAQWDKIDVPMFSVGNWSGMGLHLRGNTEAFMRAATPHKKLRIHLGSHVHPFYTEDGRRDQIRFFDYWLKGVDNGVMKEPPVKLAIRKGGNAFEWRSEHEWPLARTRWTKFYLDLSQPAEDRAGVTGALTTTKPANIASRTYAASSLGSMGSTSAASSQVMGGGIKPGMGIPICCCRSFRQAADEEGDRARIRDRGIRSSGATRLHRDDPLFRLPPSRRCFPKANDLHFQAWQTRGDCRPRLCGRGHEGWAQAQGEGQSSSRLPQNRRSRRDSTQCPAGFRNRTGRGRRRMI